MPRPGCAEDFASRRIPGHAGAYVAGRSIAIAGAVVGAVIVCAIVATYVVNPFKTASDDPRIGDTRGNNSDSRVWGFVPRENMIGFVAED